MSSCVPKWDLTAERTVIIIVHELKIAPEYFREVAFGNKTFEVRRDDRSYTVGDKLVLREYKGHGFTGNEVRAMITYILRDKNYCKDGFCILGIKLIQPNEDYRKIM